MRDVALEFKLDAEKRKDAVRTIRALVDHFEARTGTKFRVIAAKGMIHIVPQLNRNKQGLLAEQRPELDARISIRAGKRNMWDFLTEFTQAVSQASGRRIDIGTVGLNLMERTEVNLAVGFTNAPARTVLREVFILSGLKLSWRLLGGAGDENQVLNVHPVGARRLGEPVP